MRGQAVVEFALIAPVMLLMFLGFIETGRLLYTMQTWQGSAAVLADAYLYSGVEYPSEEFDAMVAAETSRTGCDVQEFTITDEGWRAVSRLVCAYHAIAYSGFEMNVTVEGVR